MTHPMPTVLPPSPVRLSDAEQRRCELVRAAFFGVLIISGLLLLGLLLYKAHNAVRTSEQDAQPGLSDP